MVNLSQCRTTLQKEFPESNFGCKRNDQQYQHRAACSLLQNVSHLWDLTRGDYLDTQSQILRGAGSILGSIYVALNVEEAKTEATEKLIPMLHVIATLYNSVRHAVQHLLAAFPTSTKSLQSNISLTYCSYFSQVRWQSYLRKTKPASATSSALLTIAWRPPVSLRANSMRRLTLSFEVRWVSTVWRVCGIRRINLASASSIYSFK